MSETKQRGALDGVKSILARWFHVRLQDLTTEHGLGAGANGLNGDGEPMMSAEGVLSLETAWACVRLISETIATLPLFLYQRRPDGSRLVASGHELYPLVHSKPNADQTAVTFLSLVVASLLLQGLAVIEIMRSSTGRRIGFQFLLPGRVTRRREAGRVRWFYSDPVAGGAPREIPESDICYIPAFSLDADAPLTPIALGASMFAAVRDAEKAAKGTYRGGNMKRSGVLSVNVPLTPAQREDYRKHVESVSAHGGFYVAEGGTRLDTLSMTPADAELLSSRKFGVERICRWFGVSPHMVGHTEKSTSWGTGLEQQQIAFVQFTLRPWLVRIEQGFNRWFLTPAEQREYYHEFAVEGLLRGDSAARANYLTKMVNGGLMTLDEGRGFENLPAMGGNAAKLLVQGAMIPADNLGQATPADAAKAALQGWLETKGTADDPPAAA